MVSVAVPFLKSPCQLSFFPHLFYPDKMPHPKKVTSLLRSCEIGDLEAVKVALADLGGDVDTQDDDGHTAVQVAAANDQVNE